MSVVNNFVMEDSPRTIVRRDAILGREVIQFVGTLHHQVF